jgi:MFS family permease
MESGFSRYGLNGLNFFSAAMQTSFGPFVAIYLTAAGWSQAGIGFALSIGTAAALLSQLPAGALIDYTHHKRGIVAASLAGIAISAAMLAAEPTRGLIWGSQVLHALASAAITPGIAAMTLALTGHEDYSKRLGVNARWASLGAAATGAALGGCAAYFSPREIFLASAALVLPALVALFAIPSVDRVEVDHPALLHPRERAAVSREPWSILRERGLVVFMAAAVLFQVANAAMLPLALNALVANNRVAGELIAKGLAACSPHTGYIVSGVMFGPQIVVAIASPWLGRAAQRWGRRPLLLAGFAAVPLRGLLFATMPDGNTLLAMQLLDGISAAVFGLMLPLIAADATQKSGFLNLAITSIGLAAGIGATVSTTMAGWIADRAGMQAAFLALAAAGALALLVLFVLMPETRPVRPPRLPSPVATV